MTKALTIVILCLLLMIAIVIIVDHVGISSSFVKNIILKRIGQALDRKIEAKEFVLYPSRGIYTKGLYIQAKDNFFLKAESASLTYDLKDILKKSLKARLLFSDVKLVSKERTLLKAIFDAMSLTGVEAFNFDTVKADLLLLPDVIRVDSLDAQGQDVRIHASGSSLRDKSIDFDIQIMLSSRIVQAAPNFFQELFVIEESAGWSTISAKIGGTIDRPSVQLRTDLLHFNVNTIENR